MARTKLEAFADDLIETQLSQIDDALEDLNKKLEVFDRIKVKRDQLQAARRALLGVGSRTTANAGSRITQDEVIAAMKAADPDSEGISVSELMGAVPGSSDAQLRGHLNRGLNERFLKRASDNKWFLRDPEAGINTVDDLPEEGDGDDDE